MKYRDQIILFSTGALFSQTVLDTLIDKNIKPAAVVLPVYAPASIENLPGIVIEDNTDPSEFIVKVLDSSIPVIYAPEKCQHNLPLQLSEIQVDYILVACWPYLIGRDITGLAGKAALNIHPSLLPKYRGANPIYDQFSDGKVELGVTLHLINQTFDQGDILSQLKLGFPSDYSEMKEFEVKSARAGAGLFIDAMKGYANPGWTAVKQPDLLR